MKSITLGVAVLAASLSATCAIWFGANFMCAIAASTASRLSSETLAVPLRMRETVLGDTPAWRATSSRVEGGAA